MLTFVGAVLKYYERERLLDKSAATMSLAKDESLASLLKFPGKVCVDELSDYCVLTDLELPYTCLALSNVNPVYQVPGILSNIVHVTPSQHFLPSSG